MKLFHFLIFLTIPFVFISCSGSQTSNGDKSTDISSQDFSNAYELIDSKYGTKTTVELKNGVRTMKTNSLLTMKPDAFQMKATPTVFQHKSSHMSSQLLQN